MYFHKACQEDPLLCDAGGMIHINDEHVICSKENFGKHNNSLLDQIVPRLLPIVAREKRCPKITDL